MGGKGSGRNQKIEPGNDGGLAAIEAAPAPLTADQVLKAVSGYAIGALMVPGPRLAALYKLGEAYRLWGARSEGVKAANKAAPKASFNVTDTESVPS